MKQTLIREYFEKNNGILNILPTFVPRRFCKAGHRLRLHPDDYFALGTHRGAIKERWFSSVICAMNGPDAAPDEGMSYRALRRRQLGMAGGESLPITVRRKYHVPSIQASRDQ